MTTVPHLAARTLAAAAAAGAVAISLWQPRASLVAAGIKRWETRSWPTKYRGRLVIAAAARRPHARDGMGPWAINFTGAVLRRDAVPYAYNPAENRSLDLPLGAVVASANLVDCVRMVGAGPVSTETLTETLRPDGFVVVGPEQMAFYRPGIADGELSVDISDQREFGIWEPGRWAWRLEDIRPTTERCPVCWGSGCTVDCLGAHPDDGQRHDPCPACVREGWCNPVPVKGGQRLWRWRP